MSVFCHGQRGNLSQQPSLSNTAVGVVVEVLLVLCGSSLTCAAASFKASWTQLSVLTFAASGSSKKLLLT
jgi:hypothetical protein